MDLNPVRAVLWFAAFSVILHGAEPQCRFCFKYFLESCDGTYRIEIGNLALSEEDLKFTKQCSNGIGGSIEKGRHQEINIIPLDQYPSVQADKHSVYAEEELPELSIHKNTVYKSQYPDILIPDKNSGHQSIYVEGSRPVQIPSYDGEESVHNIKLNVGDNTNYEHLYPEGVSPNDDNEGLESTELHKLLHLKGKKTKRQPQYLENIPSVQYSSLGGKGLAEIGIGGNNIYKPHVLNGFEPYQYHSNGAEKLVGNKGYNFLNPKGNGFYSGQLPSYGKEYLVESLKSYQRPSYTGEESFGTGANNIINLNGEKTVYKPQYLENFQPSEQPTYNVDELFVTGNHNVNNVGENTNDQPQYSEGLKPSQYSTNEAELVEFELPNLINKQGEHNIYQSQYPEGFKLVQQPSYGGEGTVDTGLHGVINSINENTNYQPQYLEGLKPDNHPSYDREGTVEIGLHNVQNTEGENIIYQPEYPKVFKPQQYPSYVQEGSVESGIHNVINNEVEKTYYQPQYPGQHPGYGGEGFVGTGMQNEIIPEGESSVYQSQYPEIFKHFQNPSYGRVNSMEIGKHNLINTEGENIFHQPQYLKGFTPDQHSSYAENKLHSVTNSEIGNINNQPQYPEYFQPGQRPKQREIDIITDHAVDIEEHHYPEEFKSNQQHLKLGSYPREGEFSSYTGARPVANEMHLVDGENTIYQPQYLEVQQSGQYPDNGGDGTVGTKTNYLIVPKSKEIVNHPQYPQYFQTGQYPNNGREGSIANGMFNVEGDNTIYQSQYPMGFKPAQQPGYSDQGSVGIQMNNIRKPEGKNAVNVYQYSQDFQPSQHPSFREEGLVGIHNEINTAGEHTIYQPVYPEDAQPNQQPSNSGVESIEIEMNNLNIPKDKQIVYEPQFPENFQLDHNSAHEGEGLVESGTYNELNLKGEQTDNHVGNGIHVLIDSEGKNIIHEPQYPEIMLPNPSFGGKVSVGIEKNNLQNLNDKIIANEPQFYENYQPGQTPTYGEEGAAESEMHNVLNFKVEQSDNQEQHPVDLQLNYHPSNGVEVPVGNGMHGLIDSEGKNILHELQYPEILIPDSNFGGKVSVDIGDQHAINVEGDNTVYQYPNNGVGGTVGIGIDNVINSKDVNSVYQPQYSEGSQPDKFIGFDGEGTLGIGLNNIQHNTGVNTIYKPQFSYGSEPSQLPSYDVVGSIEAGSHQVENTDVENTVQDLQNLNIVQPGPHPSYDGKGTVEIGSHKDINTYSVQQPTVENLVPNNLRVVYSGAQSEYPDHLHEYQNGDRTIKIGGIHTGENVEYPDGTKLMQQPNYQSEASSMQIQIQPDGNGQQSSYPNEKQSTQHVEEFNGGVVQSELGDSGSNQIRSHEFEIEHEQEVNHVSYPEVNSDNNMQSGGHITGPGNFGSLRQPKYPYLGMKGTSSLYQKLLFEPQALSGLQPEVNQLGPVIYSSSGMLQGQSSKDVYSQPTGENYLFNNPKQTVPRGVLQYLGMPSREKVVQHIVHHHVHMPSLAADLSGMSVIIEKQKLAECLKKYGKACKQLLEKKSHIPDNIWYKNYNKYFKSSHHNPMKDLYVDESSKKKLLNSKLYGLYSKQLSQYMKHLPKVEQSSSAESSEQSDENILNAIQLQALLASKKEEGKYLYAPAFMRPYMKQINQENYQNIPSAELFANIPNINSYLKSDKSANQGEIKLLNVFNPTDSTEDKGTSGKVYHKIVKKIRVRTRSKIRGRMSRRNNGENTEDYEDENTTDDPNEIVEYVEEEVPEDNEEENSDRRNSDTADSVENSNITTERTAESTV